MESYTSNLGLFTHSLTYRLADLSVYCPCIPHEACPRVHGLVYFLKRGSFGDYSETQELAKICFFFYQKAAFHFLPLKSFFLYWGFHEKGTLSYLCALMIDR